MQSRERAHSYWTGLARCYHLLGPPLRPSAEDLCVFENAVGSRPDAETALLLGVTPDIVGMRWPEACSLVAVDGSWPMVQALRLPGQRAVCGNWLALPLRSGSCDLVIGDGSLSMIDTHCLRAMARAIHAVLKQDGLLILRCYLQPSRQERAEEVFADLRRGEIPSFHHFKLRLLMAMQDNLSQGVAVNDVYERWQHEPLGTLPEGAGWQPAVVAMMDHYRDTGTVYWFSTLPEFRAVMLDCFDEVSLTFSGGYLSERCPILVFRRR